MSGQCTRPVDIFRWMINLTPEDTITLIEVISALSTLKGTPLPSYVDPGAKLAKLGMVWLRNKPSNAANKTLNALNTVASLSKLSGKSVPKLESFSKIARLLKKHYTLKRQTNGAEDLIESHTGLSELLKMNGSPLGSKHDRLVALGKIAHAEYAKHQKSQKSQKNGTVSTYKRGKREKVSPDPNVM